MATLNTTNIKHASSGSNNIILAANGSVNIPTLTTNSSFGGLKQLKSVTKTDSTSTDSASYVDITGMSVTLTPQSGTKCYVTYHLVLGLAAGYSAGVQIVRDSTAIGNGNQYNANNYYNSRGGFLTHQASYLNGGNLDYGFLDTHGADGNLVYKVQLAATHMFTGGLCRVHVNKSATPNSSVSGVGVSTITVMEVAA
jgi:hypothetical protein